MNHIKNSLKWAGGMKVLLGLIILINTSFFNNYALYCCIIGFLIFSLSNMDEEELFNNRRYILLLGLIGFFSGFISSIMTLVAYSDSKFYENKIIKKADGKKKKIIDPEVRKIDMLLKLGVGMVLISGILFATTSWNFISDITKILALSIFGTIFIGLSSFTEKKLKIEKTTYVYWLLGFSFYFFTIVGLLYFGIMNKELTYTGYLSSLSWTITWFTLGVLSYITYLRFKKEYLLTISYTSILFVIEFLLKHLGIDYIIRLIVISLILLFINYYSPKDSIIKKIGKFVTIITPILILKNINPNPYYNSIACLINIISLYIITIEEENKDYLKLLLIDIYSLFLLLSMRIEYIGNYSYLILFLLGTINTLLIQMNVIKKDKEYQEFNFIIYSIIYLISYLKNMLIITSSTFFVSVIYFIMTILLSNNIKKISSLKLSNYFQPISIFSLVYSIFNLRDFKIEVELSIIVLITVSLYCIMHYFLEDKDSKKIYFISIFIGMIISFQLNLEIKSKLPALLLLIPSIYIYLNTHLQESTKKAIKIISFSSLMIALYNTFSIVNILNTNPIISSIIIIGIILVIEIYLKMEEEKIVGLLLLIIPLLDIIRYIEFNKTYYKISLSLLILYITFIAIKYFCEDKDSKNVFGTIGIIASILIVFFEISSLIAIYIGLLGLIVIAIGYYSKELKSFFYVGIGITILNIIYQLWDLWGKIPFWLYLLVGGLSIISFVTFKEINKK